MIGISLSISMIFAVNSRALPRQHSAQRARAMAMKLCSLCYCTLPEESSRRRRLHSTSSSLALQAFVDVSSQCGLQRVVPHVDKGVNGPFLCLACCSQLEKFSKVKTNLYHLTEDVTRKISATAVCLGLSACPGKIYQARY